MSICHRKAAAARRAGTYEEYAQARQATNGKTQTNRQVGWKSWHEDLQRRKQRAAQALNSPKDFRSSDVDKLIRIVQNDGAYYCPWPTNSHIFDEPENPHSAFDFGVEETDSQYAVRVLGVDPPGFDSYLPNEAYGYPSLVLTAEEQKLYDAIFAPPEYTEYTDPIPCPVCDDDWCDEQGICGTCQTKTVIRTGR